MKRSWALTKGHFFETMSANIAQSMLTGQGLLSIPAMFAGSASRYHELKAVENATEKPKTHWLNFALPLLILLAIGGYIAIVAIAISSTNNSVNQLDTDSWYFDSEEFNNQLENEFRFQLDDSFDYDYDFQ